MFGHTPAVVSSLLWGFWLVSWLLAARWSTRAVVRQSRRDSLTHIGLISAGALFMFGRFAAVPRLGHALFPAAAWIGWVGVAAMAVGFAFTWWARLHLGDLWSANVTLKADHAIVRSGPYGVTRNPIYSGLLLALVATAIVRNDAAALPGLALMVSGLLVKVRQEERVLAARFGPAYDEYRARVPALVPRLWRSR